MVEGPDSKNNNLIVKEENNKTLGYYLGQAVGIVLVGCLSAICIALTIKIIMFIM